jgi:hypothetical protein
LVCSGSVRLRREVCDQLQQDALAAGLQVNRLA